MVLALLQTYETTEQLMIGETQSCKHLSALITELHVFMVLNNLSLYTYYVRLKFINQNHITALMRIEMKCFLCFFPTEIRKLLERLRITVHAKCQRSILDSQYYVVILNINRILYSDNKTKI